LGIFLTPALSPALKKVGSAKRRPSNFPPLKENES